MLQQSYTDIREPTGPSLEAWERRANLHLLAYVRRQLAANPRRWGAPAPYPNHAHTGPLADATRVLVKHKHQWAAIMAACGTDYPDATEQRQTWENAMRDAEAEIAAAKP